MFSLLYGLWKYMFQRDEYYILILGLDNAGKTTFLEQSKIAFIANYKGANLHKISCTVGLNLASIVANGVVLNFWDLGGQKDLQCLWDKYYAESHAIIYVVDSSDKDRMQQSKQAFDKVIGNEHLKGLPLMLVANKQDIAESLPLSDIGSIFNVSALQQASQREVMFTGVSALQGEGIKPCMEWLTESVKKNNLCRPPITGQD